MVDISDDSVETGDNVDLGLLGNDLTLDLVTHGSHGLLGGSNEGHTDLIQSLDKGSILGQETITYFIIVERVRLLPMGIARSGCEQDALKYLGEQPERQCP